MTYLNRLIIPFYGARLFSWIIAVSFLCTGCDKVELKNQVGNPVFYLSYSIGQSQNNKIAAGVNSYYMYTEDWEVDPGLVGQSILAVDPDCQGDCPEAFGIGFFKGSGILDYNGLPDGPDIHFPETEAATINITNVSGNQMLIQLLPLGVSHSIEDTFVYDLITEVSTAEDGVILHIDEAINIHLSSELEMTDTQICNLGISMASDSLGGTSGKSIAFTSFTDLNMVEWSGEAEGMILPAEENISAIFTNDKGCTIHVRFEILNYEAVEPFAFSVNYESYQTSVSEPSPYVQLFYRDEEGILYKSDGNGLVDIGNITPYEANQFGTPTIQFDIGFDSKFIRIDQEPGSLDISGSGVLASKDFR